MLRGYAKVFVGIFAVIDTLIVVASLIFSWLTRFGQDPYANVQNIPFDAYLNSLLIIVPGYLIAAAAFGLYRPHRFVRLRNELLQVLKASVWTILITMGYLFVIKEVDYSRGLLLWLSGYLVILLSVERISLRFILRFWRKRGLNNRYVVIIGAGSLGKKVLCIIREHQEFGYHVLGFMDDRIPAGEIVNGIPVLGDLNYLSEFTSDTLVDQVFIALPLTAGDAVQSCVDICEQAGLQALIIPDYYPFLPAKPRFESFGDVPIIDIRHVPLDDILNAAIKRAFDIAFSLLVLIFLSPLFIIIAILVKATSPGPVIYSQERLGKDRRTFKMYKFRTMHQTISVKTGDNTWTVKNDPRRTWIGGFLRETSLDELPQFWNVLKGDMSVIGPRPERPYFVDIFKNEIPKYMIKHRIRPGITGWAQVRGWRGDTDLEERIRCDIEYIENWSFSMDLKIVWLTIFNGFMNKNAY